MHQALGSQHCDKDSALSLIRFPCHHLWHQRSDHHAAMSPATKDDHAIERVAVIRPNVDESTVAEAAAATEAEHNMGLLKSLKLYRKACFWSIFLSVCIIMEGFDNNFLASLFAYPPFQRHFGVAQPDGTYQLTAAWQSGLTNGVLAGQIIGLFANGIIADRFGYRWTLIGALVGCIAFIFIIFFSETLLQLLIGEILIGIPWGVFQTLTTTYAAEVCPTHLRAYLTTYVKSSHFGLFQLYWKSRVSSCSQSSALPNTEP
jgi:SP family general alpha glucoside:H+ symporter-like MFS transporter